MIGCSSSAGGGSDGDVEAVVKNGMNPNIVRKKRSPKPLISIHISIHSANISNTIIHSNVLAF